jgi:3-hydroxyacyl-[acyl-carrier-protein] dehydratase
MRFLFFDRVLEIALGERILATKAVTLDGDYFTAHFPGRPVMPATLIVEAIAQAAGWLNFLTHGQSIRMVVALVEGVLLHRQVLPGETLELEARMLFRHPEGVTMEGAARVGEETVATVERLVFANQEVGRSHFSRRELEHYRYIMAATRIAEARQP